jgi:hypothetical protein
MAAEIYPEQEAEETEEVLTSYPARLLLHLVRRASEPTRVHAPAEARS